MKETGVPINNNLLQGSTNKGYKQNMEYLKKYKLDKDPAALDWLIYNNAALVHKITGRYIHAYKHKLDYDDLFSAGMGGMLTAIERFDFSYNTSFSTYATQWITQGITRAISQEGFTIRVPVHLFETLQQVMKYERCNVSEVIDVDTLCTELGITRVKYDLVKNVQSQLLMPVSLNAVVSHEGNDTELQELQAVKRKGDSVTLVTNEDPEEVLLKKDLKLHIQGVLAKLSPREQRVLTHRYGLDGRDAMTLEEIGRLEGVTRERIRQIENKAQRKLRVLLKSERHNYDGQFTHRSGEQRY